MIFGSENVASPQNAPGQITYVFGWAPPLPRLLHCLVFLPALAWEFFLEGNQCDNTFIRYQLEDTLFLKCHVGSSITLTIESKIISKH